MLTILINDPPAVRRAKRRLAMFHAQDIVRHCARMIDEDLTPEPEILSGTIPYGTNQHEYRIWMEIVRLRTQPWLIRGELMGWQEIANVLNSRGIRKRCRSEWHRASVRELVRRYCPVLAVAEYTLRQLSESELMTYYADVTNEARRLHADPS